MVLLPGRVPARRILAVAAFVLPCLGSGGEGADQRVVFSLTTIPRRIQKLQSVLDAIVEGQTRAPDAVYLAVPPSVGALPQWLLKYNQTSRRPGVLKVLRMESDYGPASKLLAAVAEGGEREPGTVLIYGDDDVIIGNLVVEQHVRAQKKALAPTAFGSRKITIGKGAAAESLLEATGTISVPASAVPREVFRIRDMPAACRLSDDFWISHHLAAAGVELAILPRCKYDYNLGVWPKSCGAPFRSVPSIEHIDALSETVLGPDGDVVRRSGGDWREQLERYSVCQRLLAGRDEL